MTDTKSYVKLLMKQGVSKGSGLGWEAEICATPDESEETMKATIDKVSRLTEYLLKKPLIGMNNESHN